VGIYALVLFVKKGINFLLDSFQKKTIQKKRFKKIDSKE